jgi:hypothetical protein
MGYRLLPTKVQYPPTVRAGEQFVIDSHWTNRAVGRAVANYHLKLILTDPTGKPVTTADAGATACDQWRLGKDYPLSSKATFTNVPPGAYALRISLIDPRTNQPIGLPLAEGDVQKSYPIGPITVAP